MSQALIEQLYEQSQCEALKKLFLEDKTTHKLIQEAIGAKLITAQDKIITTKSIDALYMICLAAKFADSEDECYRVAITIYQYHNKPNSIFPSLIEDLGLKFATKTLIALTFHKQALEKRWKYHGAPSPSFYRNLSKRIFSTYGQADISEHHEQWESFLSEVLI
jgi:hypothetical protein